MRRRVDGALLLDKPVGLTSNAALQRAKRLFRAEKAGHAGTLDPLASGLLIVLFGEATKFAGPQLDADKEYVATLKLGEKTSTGDAEGELLEKRPVTVDPGAIAAVLSRFRGEIEQIPPMYSALKQGGVPLYRLARKGETVERKARRVSIASIEAGDLDPPRLELKVRCSKGTYVRVLAEDIGEALGTGAHLAALRRTASGRFTIADAATLEDLERDSEAERDRRLVALAQLLEGLPQARLAAPLASRFRNGQSVAYGEAGAGLCAVYGASGALLGLGTAEGGLLRPQRLLSQAADNHQKTCDRQPADVECAPHKRRDG